LEELSRVGPLYGYYPNSSKTKLLVKTPFLSRANELFGDTGMQITTEGGKYLGGTIGNELFRQMFVTNKVEEWIAELESLSSFAQSHATTCSLCSSHSWHHGQVASWPSGIMFYGLPIWKNQGQAF
jgi:hypothetical protein